MQGTSLFSGHNVLTVLFLLVYGQPNTNKACKQILLIFSIIKIALMVLKNKNKTLKFS